MPLQPSDSYKESKVYKHRYLSGRRPPPKRCPFIRKNGEQCKNNVMIPYNCCGFHGGIPAKNKITTGQNSKLIKYQYMKAIRSLSPKEREDLLETDYAKDKLLDDNLMLSDAMICRLMQQQTDLIERYNIATQELSELDGTDNKKLEIATSNLNMISKGIGDLSRIIGTHQITINHTLKTKKELAEKNENEETMAGLSKQLTTSSGKELIQDLISSYLNANPNESLEGLIGLKPAAIDVPVQYELQDDD